MRKSVKRYIARGDCINCGRPRAIKLIKWKDQIEEENKIQHCYPCFKKQQKYGKKRRSIS